MYIRTEYSQNFFKTMFKQAPNWQLRTFSPIYALIVTQFIVQKFNLLIAN